MTDAAPLRSLPSSRIHKRLRRLRVFARRTLNRARIRNPAAIGAALVAATISLGVAGWNAGDGTRSWSAAGLAPVVVDPVTYVRTAELETLPERLSAERALEQAWREAGAATEGRDALLRAIALMAAGCDALESVSDYTASVERQERVNGVLKERHTVELKLRHAPLSLYLHWLDGENRGREILFIDGRNDGDMLVRSGGWKGRLIPPLKLDPNGSIAREHSRHAVTEIGMAAIGRRLIRDRLQLADSPDGYAFTIDEADTFDDRPALRTVVEYDSPAVSDFYRKSVVWIDREWLVPVGLANYAWPEPELAMDADLDAETIIEDCAFRNVRLRQQLADLDFDPSNAAYRFRR